MKWAGRWWPAVPDLGMLALPLAVEPALQAKACFVNVNITQALIALITVSLSR